MAIYSKCVGMSLEEESISRSRNLCKTISGYARVAVKPFPSKREKSSRDSSYIRILAYKPEVTVKGKEADRDVDTKCSEISTSDVMGRFTKACHNFVKCLGESMSGPPMSDDSDDARKVPGPDLSE